VLDIVLILVGIASIASVIVIAVLVSPPKKSTPEEILRRVQMMERGGKLK
jgi:hypothetical protein